MIGVMMSKQFIVKDERGYYFKQREWEGREVISSTIIDSYFVSDVGAASFLKEEEADEVIKYYSRIFPTLPKLIKEEACEELNRQVDPMKKDLQKVGLNPISLREFYIKAEAGWRDEFENWLLQYPIQKRENFCYEDWIRNYTEFAKNDERVLWIPFRSALTEFNFIVYRFKPDGFYEYIEYGEPFNEENYEFVRAYRNRDDARYFVTDHNKHLREQNKEKAEKKLIEKVTNNLVSGTVSEPIKDSEAPKIPIKLPKETLDWKEAMKALIDGKRIEARLCIPGLPESENGWFEVEFTSDQGFDESVKFGKDWDYRIKDDSKERETLFEECEKLGIIDITKISRVPTTLLYDIVNAFRSIDLNWKEIVKQVGEIG